MCSAASFWLEAMAKVFPLSIEIEFDLNMREPGLWSTCLLVVEVMKNPF